MMIFINGTQMHRQIKFVMIPDRSSSAPAYSLWQTLPSPPIVSPYVVPISSLLTGLPSLCFCHQQGTTVPLHTRSCPISQLSSSSISTVSRARCSVVQPGLQPAQLSGGCRKPPRDKAAVQSFWGQELLMCLLALSSERIALCPQGT